MHNYDTLVINVVSDTSLVYTSSSSTILPNPSLTPIKIESTSFSPTSVASVSYVYGSGPPPLIPRVTNTISSASTSLTGDPTSLLPPFATLNLGISSSRSIASISTIPLGIMHTTTAVRGRSQSHFDTCRLPKLTQPTFSGNSLHWLTFWDSFQAAIDFDTNLRGVQKFNCIKAQLDGDAARTIGRFPLTDSNYLHAAAYPTRSFRSTPQGDCCTNEGFIRYN